MERSLRSNGGFTPLVLSLDVIPKLGIWSIFVTRVYFLSSGDVAVLSGMYPYGSLISRYPICYPPSDVAICSMGSLRSVISYPFLVFFAGIGLRVVGSIFLRASSNRAHTPAKYAQFILIGRICSLCSYIVDNPRFPGISDVAVICVCIILRYSGPVISSAIYGSVVSSVIGRVRYVSKVA